MTTRAEMRSMLRRRLGDTGPAPLWDDLTMDEAIAAALHAYGARVPRERTTAVAIAIGAHHIELPPEAGRVRRVRDPAGRSIDRWREDAETVRTARGQAWRPWDGGVSLAEPAAAGIWEIDSLGPRAQPADDAAALDVVAGDEEILTLLAMTFALERRAIDEAKRGLLMSQEGTAERARFARIAVEQALAARWRRARMGEG